MNIGEKLKNLRKSRSLTLDDISRKCGVGKATLSRIENNITAGTLKTHMRICDVLNIELKDLYEDLDMPQEDIAAIDGSAQDEADVFSYDNKAKSIILTKQAQKKNMLPQLLILELDGKTPIEQNPSGTEKFVYCIEGQVLVSIDQKEFKMKDGMSVYFRSSTPHHFTNIGKKAAQCLIVSCPVAL